MMCPAISGCGLRTGLRTKPNGLRNTSGVPIYQSGKCSSANKTETQTGKVCHLADLLWPKKLDLDEASSTSPSCKGCMQSGYCLFMLDSRQHHNLNSHTNAHTPGVSQLFAPLVRMGRHAVWAPILPAKPLNCLVQLGPSHRNLDGRN